MFAFGIDPVGGGLPADQPSDWPAFDRVRQYVEEVRDELDEGLAKQVDGVRPEGDFSPALLLNVAVEHRLMHAETLAYMLHRLPYDQKIAPLPVSRLAPVRAHSAMIEIPAGPAKLGLSRNAGSFGWDNEYDQHTVQVEAFAIDRYKTTNAEYLGFVNDGGYDAYYNAVGCDSAGNVYAAGYYWDDTAFVPQVWFVRRSIDGGASWATVDWI